MKLSLAIALPNIPLIVLLKGLWFYFMSMNPSLFNSDHIIWAKKYDKTFKKKPKLQASGIFKRITQFTLAAA